MVQDRRQGARVNFKANMTCSVCLEYIGLASRYMRLVAAPRRVTKRVTVHRCTLDITLDFVQRQAHSHWMAVHYEHDAETHDAIRLGMGALE